MKHLIFAQILAIAALCSCTRPQSGNHLAFQDVSFVKTFQEEIAPQKAIPVHLDQIGLKDFKIVDSLMLTSSRKGDSSGNMIGAFSLKSLKRKTSFLKMGKGPEEILHSPSFISVSMSNANDSVRMHLLNGRGGVLSINLCQSLKEGRLNCSIEDDGIPEELMQSWIRRGPKEYICAGLDESTMCRNRYILRNGVKAYSKNQEILNSARFKSNMDDGFSFNALSAMMAYSPKTGRVVEAQLQLNEINIYSLDGQFAKTVCVGKKLDDIDETAALDMADKKIEYQNLKTYPSFIAALYLGTNRKEKELFRRVLPVIQIFSWDGKPLCRIALQHQASSFDFDLKNKTLYTLDSADDSMYEYVFSNTPKFLKY